MPQPTYVSVHTTHTCAFEFKDGEVEKCSSNGMDSCAISSQTLLLLLTCHTATDDYDMVSSFNHFIHIA